MKVIKKIVRKKSYEVEKKTEKSIKYKGERGIDNSLN